jgi:hypothetical protein
MTIHVIVLIEREEQNLAGIKASATLKNTRACCMTEAKSFISLALSGAMQQRLVS